MTKKELRRILKNLCDYKNWTIINPSLFINSTQTALIVDVYDKCTGSVWHVYIDTESRYYTHQFLSPFSIHERYRNSLDRFM